jgi:hypothetical protein
MRTRRRPYTSYPGTTDYDCEQEGEVAAAPPVRCVSEDHLNSTPEKATTDRGPVGPSPSSKPHGSCRVSLEDADFHPPGCCYLSVPHWLGPWPYPRVSSESHHEEAGWRGYSAVLRSRTPSAHRPPARHEWSREWWMTNERRGRHGRPFVPHPFFSFSSS